MRLYEFIQQEASINEVYKFKQNQPVVFVGKDGEATTGVVVGPDPAGDENMVFVKGDSNQQEFRIRRDKLLDPKTREPFVEPNNPQSGERGGGQAGGGQEAPVDANNDGKDDTTGKPVSGDLNTTVKDPKQVQVPGSVKQGQNPQKDGPIAQDRKQGTNAGLRKKIGNLTYLWQGFQWVVDNPGAPNNGQVADKGATKQLGLPHVDELILDINNANVAHLAAGYILGAERALDTSDMRSSAKGTRYDNQKGKSALDTTKPNAAINQDTNAQLNAPRSDDPAFQNAPRDQY